MAMTAEQVLNRSFEGTTLTFRDQVIAEIKQKENSHLEIQDIHGKGWKIRLDRLDGVDFQSFLSDLARSIAHAAPDAATDGSARSILADLGLGDQLMDSGTILGILVGIQDNSEFGPVITLKDHHGNLHEIYLGLIPHHLSYKDFLDHFQIRIETAKRNASEPLIFRYFKDEFTPKILAQLDYDHECWGDTWLIPPPEGQEADIRQRVMEYFEMAEQFGKDVPWLKIARHAIVAQAREDHPEWLL